MSGEIDFDKVKAANGGRHWSDPANHPKRLRQAAEAAHDEQRKLTMEAMVRDAARFERVRLRRKAVESGRMLYSIAEVLELLAEPGDGL